MLRQEEGHRRVLHSQLNHDMTCVTCERVVQPGHTRAFAGFAGTTQCAGNLSLAITARYQKEKSLLRVF